MMKKLFPFLTLMSLCCQLSLSAQGGSGGIGPSDIKRPPLIRPPAKYVPQAPIPVPQQKVPDRPSSAISPTYSEPGILSYKNGQWAGADHLYNISNTIPIVVDFIKSDKIDISLTGEDLQKRIEAAFIKEGILVNVASTGRPPLPFFNIVVMIIPVGDGAATASCSGRLFEIVDNKRSNLENGVFWQAITWEDQQLVVSSVDQAANEIATTVDIIVKTFLDRYNYFQKIRP